MQWVDVTTPPSERTLRQFAALWLIFFVSIGAWRALHQRHGFDMVLVALGLVVGTLGMARPAAIRWIYTGWMIAAFPLGWAISQIMLAGLFYAVFTPVAATFRLMKRDSLQLRRRENVKTYWRPKPGATDVRDYFRQF
jgi:Saxitoxin biosynthesis operon protein SxtJ